MSEIPRLRWLCRRGMKELDLLLNRYIEHGYTAACTAEQQTFAEILHMPDPELYDLILGRTESSDTDIADLIKTLRDSLSS